MAQPRGAIEQAAVEPGAVARVEVGREDGAAMATELEVVGRDRVVVDDDVAGVPAADDEPLPIEDDLPPQEPVDVHPEARRVARLVRVRR